MGLLGYLRSDGLKQRIKVLEQDNLNAVWAWDPHVVPSIWKCALTFLHYPDLDGLVGVQGIGQGGQRARSSVTSFKLLTITSGTCEIPLSQPDPGMGERKGGCPSHPHSAQLSSLSDPPELRAEGPGAGAAWVPIPLSVPRSPPFRGGRGEAPFLTYLVLGRGGTGTRVL